MLKIIKYFLSWNAPLFVQKTVVKLLSNFGIYDLSNFSQDKNEKEAWANCSKVICNVGYPKNEIMIPQLFRWLQDLTWPGAKTIYDFLKKLETPVFIKYCELAIHEALNENDDIWLEYISCIVNDKGVTAKDFNDSSIYTFICEIYKNYIKS
jgi:hypothetical protein